MLDALNAILAAFGHVWDAVFAAPLYGQLTWGYFFMSCAVVGILISFFIGRFK